MTILQIRLIALILAVAGLAISAPSIHAATAAGASIEIDGNYIGGYTITRKKETREELIRGLSKHPITFRNDYKLTVDKGNLSCAVLCGDIRISSEIAGDKKVRLKTRSLRLVKRKEGWSVDTGPLMRFLSPQSEGEKTYQPEKNGLRIFESPKGNFEVGDKLPNNGKSGFYGMLSPEVGGGHMVSVPWGHPDIRGTVTYLSVDPILEVRDIKISTISGYSVVSIFLNPSSRKKLLEDLERPSPSVFAVNYMEDGDMLWSRSVADILAEKWVIVGIYKSKEEAKKVTERLRLAGSKKSVNQATSIQASRESIQFSPYISPYISPYMIEKTEKNVE